jgi:histidinol-phosphate phosphatase family protein
MECAIIAGGRGTRLGLEDIPKPMVPVAGKPLLEHQIELVRSSGIRRVYILSGYLAEVIRSHFGRGEDFGIEIEHIVEDTPLGTAGAVKQLSGRVTAPFLVLYGDVYVDIDLPRFIERSEENGGLGTLVVHPNDHPQDSDLLDIDRTGRIVEFFSKPHDDEEYFRNLVSAAMYRLHPDIFARIPDGTPSDFGRDIFPRIVREGGELYAYSTPEYVKDLGTPDRLEKVERDILSGKAARRNLISPQRAIFFDRDGIINREIGGVTDPADFELLPWASPAVQRVNRSTFLAVCVTNQPVIAKGFCTEEDVKEIHRKMETLLGRDGTFFDAIYYCPHHPERGFPGEVEELKIECTCRKPAPGMLEKAAEEYNIDLTRSFIIGDREVDVEAGTRAGCMGSILINSEGNLTRDSKADMIFTDLIEAVDTINEDLS